MKATFTFLALAALVQLLTACGPFPKPRAQTASDRTYRTMMLIGTTQAYTMDGDTMSADAVAQAVHQRYPEAPFDNGKIVDAWGRPILRRTPRADRGICVHLRSAGPDGVENTADDIIDDCQLDTRGLCPPMPLPANVRTF